MREAGHKKTSKRFFIADYHLGDDFVAAAENRPRLDVDEIVARFNEVVSEDDVTYILGDMCSRGFFDNDDLKTFLGRLNGRKILVMGNHDREISGDPAEWRAQGFDEVYDVPVLVDGFFLLSHEPAHMSRYSPYVNIFGHVHSNDMYRTYSACGACVCVERNDFRPVCFDEIKEHIASDRERLVQNGGYEPGAMGLVR